MQVALVSLVLVSTQAPLISHSVNLPEICGSRCDCRLRTRIQNYEYEERREGAYARDKLNIRANASSPLFSKISVQKGGTYFWELTVIVVWFNLHYLVDHRNCFFDRVTEVT